MEVFVDNNLRLFHLACELVNEDLWDVITLALGARLEELNLELGIPVEPFKELFNFKVLVKDFILRVFVLLKVHATRLLHIFVGRWPVTPKFVSFYIDIHHTITLSVIR